MEGKNVSIIWGKVQKQDLTSAKDLTLEQIIVRTVKLST